MKFYPYEKRVGEGRKKFSHAEGEGAKKVLAREPY